MESKSNTKADTIRKIRDAIRNDLCTVSSSTLNGPIWKSSVVPPGINMLCITNIKPTVGSINLNATLTYSQKSFDMIMMGISARQITKEAVQYPVPIIPIKINVKVKVNFVNGLSV